MKKLYVGNLPYDMTRDDLSELFQTHGELEEVYLVKDRRTRRLKGYAFVAYKTEAEAQAALVMDGQEYEGRALKVSLAKGVATSSAERRDHRHTKGRKAGLGFAGVVLTIIISALTSFGVSQYSQGKQIVALRANVRQLRAEAHQLKQAVVGNKQLVARQNSSVVLPH